VLRKHRPSLLRLDKLRPGFADSWLDNRELGLVPSKRERYRRNRVHSCSVTGSMRIWDGELAVQPPPSKPANQSRWTINRMKSWTGRAILYLGLADLVNTAASHGILNSWRSFPWSRQVKASDLSVGAQR